MHFIYNPCRISRPKIETTVAIPSCPELVHSVVQQDEVIDDAYACARKFFSLPIEEKSHGCKTIIGVLLGLYRDYIWVTLG